MPPKLPKKSVFLQLLRRSLRQAKAAHDMVLWEELQQVQHAWQQPFPRLTRLLQQASSHQTKHYIAEAFALAQDPRAVPVLIRAAKQPENSADNAPYFWACEHYDCSAYLSFFVQFLLQCQDPGEAMLACVAVIEAMPGPFAPPVIKRAITRLLLGKRPVVMPELQVQHELFLAQASYALADAYFEQVDQAWKTDAGTPWTFYQGLNQKSASANQRKQQEPNSTNPNQSCQ
ncbi:hypothetical protein [Hymenobacter crusticola]|uniref:Uncharacterized protein n=1 Tax=Hymenobacter crusticola TaxID=1770526 RepID=A0A2C9ZTS7_9BACT|nr:hypothetical protein [Hymenobacter crusticola]OUJ68304.1 hypothetical protein BXP70_28070 [Hymenobacter crusticola]